MTYYSKETTKVEVKAPSGEYFEVNPTNYFTEPYAPPPYGAIRFTFNTGEVLEFEDIGGSNE